MYKSFAMPELIMKLRPTHLIILSYISVIFLGAIMLNLPISSHSGEGVGFVNAFFTSSSAFCSTGLTVKNTLLQWTPFGKIVILILIQVGGMGVITLFTAMLVFTGRRITLKERMVLQQNFSQENQQGIVSLVRKTFLGTILVELVGAIFLSFTFIPEFGVLRGAFYSIFHSVSSFCNAGFDLIGSSSLTPYVSNYLVNIPIMLLITIGGLGYTVWLDVIKLPNTKKSTKLSFLKRIRKLALHTKIVLVMTTVLFVVSAIFYFVFEYNNAFKDLDFGTKMLASMFQSVVPRSGGLSTVNFDTMTPSSKFFTIIMMIIGGSPVGTAGGIKTVSVALIIISFISIAKGSSSLQAFERNIPFSALQKTLAVLVIALAVVIGGTMLLTITEKYITTNGEFLDVLFEVASAFGTCGLSLGLTPHLSLAGKIIISVIMILGHFGPIMLVTILKFKEYEVQNVVNYPEEKIVIG